MGGRVKTTFQVRTAFRTGVKGGHQTKVVIFLFAKKKTTGALARVVGKTHNKNYNYGGVLVRKRF